MELDLRNRIKEQRTLRWFVNGIQQKYFFTCIPASVKMGIVMVGRDDCLEFVSFDGLREPTRQVKRDELGYTFEGEEL